MDNILSPADRAALIAQLMRHEGTKRDAQGRHIAYRCTAGALTIGYGHNLDANPMSGIGEDSRLSEAEAQRILAADIAEVEAHLYRALPFIFQLDAVRYAALVNMAFNLGVSGLLGFKNTLADMQQRQYTSAAKRMLDSKWARQVGYRARELTEQIKTGAWA